jgi:hypothetical protein
MEKTQTSDWLGRSCSGYIVNAEFTDDNADVISGFLEDVEARFGNAVYCMPKKSLHITLLDWIAPLFDYGGKDKEALFAQVREQYDGALAEATGSQQPFDVRFNKLRVFPNTIVLLGEDDGQFAAMRSAFVDNVELLPDTKRPPQIIHSSLVRFKEELDMSEVEEFVAGYDLDITQPIEAFRLIHTKREPLAEFDILKLYDLGAKI